MTQPADNLPDLEDPDAAHEEWVARLRTATSRAYKVNWWGAWQVGMTRAQAKQDAIARSARAGQGE